MLTCIVPYWFKKLALSLFSSRTYETQHIVFVAMIYYSIVVRILSQSLWRKTKAKCRAIHFQAAYAFSLSWTVADSTLLNQQQKHSNLYVMFLSREALCLRFVSGAASVGALCLACTKVPESQKENRFLA